MNHKTLETFELIMGREGFYKDMEKLQNSTVKTLKLQIKQAACILQAKSTSKSFLMLERLEMNLHETRTYIGMNDGKEVDLSVDFNEHPKLQYISVSMENLTYAALRQLKMDKLRKFEWRYNKYKVNIDWDSFAKRNPNIEEFYLKGIALTDSDLENISKNLSKLRVFEYDPNNHQTEWENNPHVLNVKSLPILLNNCKNLRRIKMKLKKLFNPVHSAYNWGYGRGNKDDLTLQELQPRLDQLESYEFQLNGKVRNREFFKKD